MIGFRAVRPGDIARLSRDMREIDRRECAALGRTPKEALRRALNQSHFALAATINDKCEAMFGVVVVDLASGVGTPWMLATPRALEHPSAWAREAPSWLERIERLTPILVNQVGAENVAAIRWLTRLGFTVSPETVHVGGLAFRRFSKGLVQPCASPLRSAPPSRRPPSPPAP